MLRAFLSTALLILLLAVSGFAQQWSQMTAGDVNEPTYGTARDMAVVHWSSNTYVFAADYNKYLFKSTDGGDNWSSADPQHSTKTTLVFPNPYVSGAVYIARDALGYEGFWCSTDGGNNFSPRNGSGSNLLSNKSIACIYVDPNEDENEVHAVYVTCKAVTGDQGKRIFKTVDEGLNWTEAFSTVPKGTPAVPLDVTAMYILPNGSESPNVWIGTGVADPEYDSYDAGVWHSTDGGEEDEWVQELGGCLGSNECFNDCDDHIYVIHSVRKIIQSPDYYSNNAGPYCYVDVFRPYYTISIAHEFELYWRMSASEESPCFTIMNWLQGSYGGEDESEWNYISSADIVRASDGYDYCILGFAHRWQYVGLSGVNYIQPGLYRWPVGYMMYDVNGDPNLINISNGIYMPNMASLAIDPDPELYENMYVGTGNTNDINTIYSTFGGVYRTADWGESWTEITKGMHTCASTDIQLTEDYTLMAGGTQPDQVSKANMFTLREWDSGWSSRFDRSFDSFRDFTAFDNGNSIAVAVGDNDAGEETIYFSGDGGETFEADYTQTDEYDPPQAYALVSADPYVIASFSKSPFVVMRDGDGNWSELSNGDIGWPTGSGNDGMAMAYSPTSGFLYVGTSAKGLYMIDINSPTAWSYSMLENEMDNISAISVTTINGVDQVIAAGTVHGEPAQGMIRFSIDGGSNWYAPSQPIPSTLIIRSLARKGNIVAATAHDASLIPYVYLSADRGNHWRPFGQLDNNLVHEVKDVVIGGISPYIQGDMAYVGTDFGIFTSGFYVAPPIIYSETTWTSDAPIFVTEDVSIQAGATLTIKPGAKIYFSPRFDGSASGTDANRCELKVYGSLVANAAGDSTITFMPWIDSGSTDTAAWYGIYGNIGSHITMKNCSFERSIVGVRASAAYLDIRHCSFSDNASYGVLCTNSPDYAVVDSNTFLRCYNRAIAFTYGIGHNFVGNQITDCKNGIQYNPSVSTSTASEIKYNTISNDLFALPGFGVNVLTSSPIALNLMGNTVSGYDAGIVLSKVNSGILTGNYCHDNNYGLYLTGVTANFNCTAETHNAFNNNAQGISCNSYTSSAFRYNKVNYNDEYAVYIDEYSTPNFGTLGDHGNNSLDNDAAYDIYNTKGGNQIYAQYCYWGEDQLPNYNQFVACDSILKGDPLPGAPRIASDLLLPTNTVIASAYPNPFNPTTTIAFTLPQAANLKAEIFNIMGQKVQTLHEGFLGEGAHSLIWNGADESGKAQASGIYFFKLTGDGVNCSTKMTLLR